MKYLYFLKRYKFSLVCLFILLIIYSINNNLGENIFLSAKSSFFQMLSVLPPIMLMLGLLDVWVSRESMMKYMGNDSGFMGVILSILIASLAAGPMYAAFPFTAVLLKKGVRFSNIIVFMNAWCVTKLSTLLFEIGALGYKFTLIRLLIDIPGIIIMGYIVEYLASNKKYNISYLSSSKNIH